MFTLIKGSILLTLATAKKTVAVVYASSIDKDTIYRYALYGICCLEHANDEFNFPEALSVSDTKRTGHGRLVVVDVKNFSWK